MQEILVLNNRSESIEKLENSLENLNANITVKMPMEDFKHENYSGIIISGGFLPKDRYKEILNWYKQLITSAQIPILGICLGLRIIGYYYGARIRKLEKEENGIVKIYFHKEYPLAPSRKELTVYETHLYELISTGENLENYGSSDTCKIQALKHKNKKHFAVQFHPEIQEKNEGIIILEHFLRLCQKSSLNRRNSS